MKKTLAMVSLATLLMVTPVYSLTDSDILDIHNEAMDNLSDCTLKQVTDSFENEDFVKDIFAPGNECIIYAIQAVFYDERIETDDEEELAEAGWALYKVLILRHTHKFLRMCHNYTKTCKEMVKI